MRKESPMKNEISELTERAIRFCEMAVTPVEAGAICGDGGYGNCCETTRGETVEVHGYTSMLGGDMSMIMGAIAYCRQRGEAYDAHGLTEQGIKATVEIYGRFDFHTSHHEEHDHLPTDCGHIKRMTDPDLAAKYLMDPKDALQAIAYAKSRSVEDPRVCEQNLNRDHAEGMVLVNEGLTTTFVHWLRPDEFPEVKQLTAADAENGLMNFVVDVKRAESRHEQIWLKMGYSEADLKRLHEIRAIQASATNGGLAEGKPVFRLNWDDPRNRMTEYLGTMQADGSIE
jgi:hypothetical protein